MKIAIINSVDNGSTGKIALDCVKGAGKEYKFFVGRKYLDNAAIKFTQKWERGGHAILSELLDVDEQCSILATKKLIKELRDFNPDIIHLHNLHGYYINYVMLFKYIKSIDVKVIWTLHDCWAFTGHCAHFDYVGCDKWINECYKCPNLKTYPKSMFFDRSKKLFQIKKKIFTGIKDLTIVCPSMWLANLVQQSFLKEYSVNVIHNGINLDNFTPIDNHTFDKILDRNKKIVLGVAGSFSERKGYYDFIKLSSLIDNKKYQIVMVGVTLEQTKDLNKYGIVGISRTENQKQLAELYSIASVFLNLTYEDNFPTVNIEALACGTPVITYKTGGSPEIIDKKCGIVIDKGNYNALIKEIPNAIALKVNAKEYMQKIKIDYSISKMVKEYKKLYCS